MSCTLSIHRESAAPLEIPLSAAGRLTVHLDGGGSFQCTNSPALPADQGGGLPIYDGAAIAFVVPFTCPGVPSYSAGRSGGVGLAGASEGGASGAGALSGRLG